MKNEGVMESININNHSVQAELIVIYGNGEIRQVPYNDGLSVGRENTDLIIHSSIVSRRHGVFFVNDGKCWYRDCNSRNGTYVNGAKLKKYDDNWSEPVMLQDGDILKIDRSEASESHPEAVEILFRYSCQGDDIWKTFDFDGTEEVRLGRQNDNDIVINNFSVSRNHALLKKFDDQWVVIDCESKNGVSLNKSQVEEYAELNKFDMIKISQTTFIFLENKLVYNEQKKEEKSDLKFDYSNRKVLMNVNLNEVSAKRSLVSQKKVLLRDIRFDIESGDFTLVLGGAGAGKSTLIKAITGQLRSTGHNLIIDGKVTLDGMDLYRNLKSLKHRIGIVPQYPDYRVNDTVYHTILDSAKLQLSGEYTREEIEQRVESVIEKMMLTSIRDSELGVISGGQRKRVQVAIKAIGDISFFTFDEPDAGLDVAGRIDQMNQLTAPITRNESVSNSLELKHCTESGHAGLMISHYPDDVAHMYKKVIVLAKSKKDNAGHLAYYGDVNSALRFFGVNRLSEIVLEINYEGGKGRGDEFIEKYNKLRR